MEELQLKFEGPGVQEGLINADLLAEALSGYSQTFNRANNLLNGPDSQSAVFVESGFRQGSFIVDLQLVQNWAAEGMQLLRAHPMLDASGLSGVLGFGWRNRTEIKDGLLEVYKWLKGKKPDATTRIGESVEITFGENKKTVTNNVFNLYGDEAIRQGLAKFASPLGNAAVERISILRDGVEEASLDKSELAYFGSEAGPELSNSPVSSGERRAALTVSKLSFTEKSNWTFFEQGSTVVATIEDENFWRQVHDRTVTFGEGDTLVVDLAWRVERKSRLIQRNTIRKVLRVISRPARSA